MKHDQFLKYVKGISMLTITCDRNYVYLETNHGRFERPSNADSELPFVVGERCLRSTKNLISG
uniref:Uncharacterized protein n=1 Tax=Romanomermis culicivorax TaxID=13658 RepID=A0A915II74_ROMCU